MIRRPAIGLLLAGPLVAACAVQRSQVAQQAQATMIGMPREQVLGCMGPPANKATEGRTEVWSYSTAPTMSMDRGTGATRYCVVNVTMTGAVVTDVAYQGPTGGLGTPGEQCAYAVARCVPTQ